MTIRTATKSMGCKAPRREAHNLAKYGAVLDARDIPYDQKWNSGKLRGMVVRSNNGLTALSKCTRAELLRFCSQRVRDMEWAQIDFNIYTVDDLTMMLEEADDEPDLRRLLDLPSELRNIVYEYVLLHRETGKPTAIEPGNVESYKRSLQTLALTQASRSLREEALPLYYAINTFYTNDFTNFGLTAKWHGIIGQPALQHIRRISRCLDTVCKHYDDEAAGTATLLIDLSGPTADVRHGGEREESCKMCAKEDVGVEKMLETLEEGVEREEGVPQMSVEIILALIHADVLDLKM
ncbi:hypothetical protein LTR85_002494 [Meristemomyces frigidus]|nr:hypothetical protein LTR85_002494 [Meristemomyces frigidus]